ncbi:hypothetical protein [Mitsuokella multacida]|uniref:hypothetical protein n=1 Tax=Mitsuokella multacida TaxID=52226 RepID=UPI003F63F75F
MTRKIPAILAIILCLILATGCSRMSETAVPVKHNVIEGDVTEMKIDLPVQMSAKAQNLTPTDTQGFVVKQLGYVDKSKNAANFSAMAFSSVHLNTDKINALGPVGKKSFHESMEKAATKGFTNSFLQSVNGHNSTMERKDLTINGIDVHEYLVTYQDQSDKTRVAKTLYIPDETEVWFVIIDYSKDDAKAEKQADTCLSSIKLVKK